MIPFTVRRLNGTVYECQSQQGTGTLDSIKRATFDSTGAKECQCGACCRLLVAVLQILELTVSYAMHTGYYHDRSNFAHGELLFFYRQIK
jgi:hypothetical protein